MSNDLKVLILHGPPAAGKTSLAATLAAFLRKKEVKHAVIDMDYLAKIYPRDLIDIMYINLASIWPNYVNLGDIKIIIPTYLQKGELEIVMNAAPAKKTIACEVTAPMEELERRIAAREQDEVYRKLHLNYLHKYPENGPLPGQIDFQVINHRKTQDETALEILQGVG
jgi:cellulose biosynthesis protein BcsQ